MSKDIKKALEHCIEWNCADCPNREELGSGETVCRGRLLPEVLEYVADLEAKLAESEKLTERLQQIVDKLRDKEFAGKTLVEAVNAVYEPLYKNKYDEAEELKQQLAEKEKEIERLNLEFETQEDWQEKWQKLYDETCNLNQDKISFAIDKLEKVKENAWQSATDISCLLDYTELAKIIDNQIKQLNEGVKNEQTR